MFVMRRRDFVALLGVAAAAWPVAALAQQPAMPLIGFMSTLSPENVSNPMAGFHQGLKEAGYIESQNVAIEYRWAQGHYDRMPELAADLVRKKVAVIVASGGDPSPQIAKAATQTIPIVFGMFGDPVKEGLVDSLSRLLVSPYLVRQRSPSDCSCCMTSCRRPPSPLFS
jgi:putative ABC transport system substrate-binding protein